MSDRIAELKLEIELLERKIELEKELLALRTWNPPLVYPSPLQPMYPGPYYEPLRITWGVNPGSRGDVC